MCLKKDNPYLKIYVHVFIYIFFLMGWFVLGNNGDRNITHLLIPNAQAATSCPTGQILVSGICIGQGACPQGEHNTPLGCVADALSCPTGQTLVSGICVGQAICPQGTHITPLGCVADNQGNIGQPVANTTSQGGGGIFNYKLMGALPFIGKSGDVPNLTVLVLGIYRMILWIVGISSLFMLSVGGFYYISSAGNTSTANTAKQIITDSLIGLAIALVSWGLLYVINSDLVEGNPDGPQMFQAELTPAVYSGSSTGTGTGAGTAAPSPSSSACKPGTKCISCPSCVPISDCKHGQNPDTCHLVPSLASRLSAALGTLSGANDAWVTEGWPPTVNHDSSCHMNGTCADVNLRPPSTDINKVKAVYQALIAAGLHPVYEHYDCTNYRAAGINCKYYKTMTSPSFHVNP